MLLMLAYVSAFQTGNSLINTCMPQDNCIGYVSGAIDGLEEGGSILGIHLFCSPKGLSQGQAAAIFAKYLEDHPENRHLAAADLLLAAMRKAYPCPVRRRK